MSGQPLPWNEIVRRFKILGFEGPVYRKSKADHPYMVKGTFKVKIPNRHGSDIDGALIERVRKVAGFSKEEWEEAGRS